MVNNQTHKLLFCGRGLPGHAGIHGLLGGVTPRPYVSGYFLIRFVSEETRRQLQK